MKSDWRAVEVGEKSKKKKSTVASSSNAKIASKISKKKITPINSRQSGEFGKWMKKKKTWKKEKLFQVFCARAWAGLGNPDGPNWCCVVVLCFKIYIYIYILGSFRTTLFELKKKKRKKSFLKKKLTFVYRCRMIDCEDFDENVTDCDELPRTTKTKQNKKPSKVGTHTHTHTHTNLLHHQCWLLMLYFFVFCINIVFNRALTTL